MSYSAAKAYNQIQAIGAVLPRVMSLTTDVSGNLSDFSQSTLGIQRFNGKTVRLDLTPHRTHEDRTIERFRAANNLTVEDASTVYWAARELFKLNPRGSWCAAPDPEGTVLSMAALRANESEQPGFVVRSASRLAELLPSVERIAIESCTKNGADGRLRRRTWIRFHAGAFDELSAIDTGTIAVHVHDGLMDTPSEYKQANELRLAVWAKQLGIDASDAPEVLHLCGLFAVQLSFGAIAFD